MEVDTPTPPPPAADAASAEPVEATMAADLLSALTTLERYMGGREPRHMVQALRMVGIFRKKSKADPAKAVGTLSAVLSAHVAPSAALRSPLVAVLETLPQPMEPVVLTPKGEDDEKKTIPASSKLPENEMFVGLLVLTLLLDTNHAAEAMPLSLQLMDRVAALKRRTLDPIAERIYFYASWAHEINGNLAAIRSPLLAAHRTACLHHNTVCQATLLNLLLRNYQHYKLFDQAEKLLTKTSFPENASGVQTARYLYYTGRIKALQLEYTEAHRCLLQAQRKAPTSKGLGFRLTVHKLGAIVQLLLGEIPDRAVFRHPQSRSPMRPYMELVQAVRMGDLAAFRGAMEKHATTFTADTNYTLIVRLRQNVIRAGLRNISLAYSRIALSDVATKLVLDHPEDMESIAAKAIRDGVIEAQLDHKEAVLISKEPTDVYSTLEPQAAFHKRITFCLNVHNDAVKAMSYPPDAHKGELPDAEAMKQRKIEEDEIAEALAEDDFD